MSLYISSLNSGSNGNCYYVGNDLDAVLVDAGLSCRETEARMRSLDLDMKKLKAIFVSHEHTDHVRGLAGLASKYKLPVYVTDATRKGCYHLEPASAVHFETNEEIRLGSLKVKCFSKFHDAADPHSFTIESNGVTVGVFTDLGRPCEELIRHFKLCHAAFLEANYDDEMLEAGRYPYFLKNRIRGGNGHLSNRQALEVFMQHRPAFMSHLLLAHLSADNNCPDLVAALFGRSGGGVKISVASRYEASPVFLIRNNGIVNSGAAVSAVARKRVLAAKAQLSLFAGLH